MKLVIIGAGASYDCISEPFDDYETSSYRPPLANSILDTNPWYRTIINKYPGVRAHHSEANSIDDIENFFQDKWNYITLVRDDNLIRDLINIQYYLSELFLGISKCQNGINNYDVLLRKAYEYSQIKRNEHVVFVSFNYDTILDQSFERVFKHEIESIDDYIKFPIKIIKPHGSCNWFNEIKLKFEIPENNESEIAYAVYVSGLSLSKINRSLFPEVKIINDTVQRSIGERGADNKFFTNGFFPRLMLPFKLKDDFVMPKEHLDALRRHLENVDEILIIGWKAGEEKFKKLLLYYLQNKKIKITCVTVDDRTAFNYFKENFPYATPRVFGKSGSRKGVEFTTGGFSAYINRLSTLIDDNPFRI